MSDFKLRQLNTADKPSVVAFSLNRRAASSAFTRYISKNKLNSTEICDAAERGEFRAEYIPACLIDFSFASAGDAVCTLRKGEEFEKYSSQRIIESGYSGILLSSSRKADDTLLRLLEPYSLEIFTDNIYSLEEEQEINILKAELEPDELFKAIKPELEKEAENQLKISLNEYTDKTFKKIIHSYKEINIRHILLPVWVLEYEYEGELCRLFLNGQTGKPVGVPPKSRKKVLAMLLAAAAAGAGLGQLIWMAVSVLI